ncbi:S8 family peptidase [Paenibacillus xerothermodurans]|uniref:Peptidase S8/S53 domain-containing protein n=1 Tax=Paenibacillus xerothermodurans TaxID=1977292 RepID=A0A2W1NQN7_PAEXE|nr:S8 family serine peptidase [Paenibacillus xerothermodurans]PZE20046.1 hypothetical protein CBW46_015305 [Paenibacillus xerothermodurans]
MKKWLSSVVIAALPTVAVLQAPVQPANAAAGVTWSDPSEHTGLAKETRFPRGAHTAAWKQPPSSPSTHTAAAKESWFDPPANSALLKPSSLGSDANARAEGEQIVVFSDARIPDEVLELLQKDYPDIAVTVVPEIGTIKLEGTEQTGQAIERIKQAYPYKVDSTGPEQRITVPGPPPADKLAPGARALPTAPETMRSLAAPRDGEIDVTGAVYYQWFGWDIQKVTEGGKSFAKEAGSHRVKIGVIDSGVDFNHPDLKANIVAKGKSFVPGVTSTEDRLGHGTMTAGAIAANGAMLGVGPKLGLVPYKVMDNAEDGAESIWVIQAIIQAARDECDVINVSLGTYKSMRKPLDRVIVEAYKRAVQYAHIKGSIVVASAGNDGIDLSDPEKVAEQRGNPGDRQVHLPGVGVRDAISVSATNKSDQLSFFSNYGEGITVAAPGGDYGADWLTEGLLDPRELVFSTFPTNLEQPVLSEVLGLPHGYTLSAGTSLAVPKVSGAVGVMIAYQKERGWPLSVNKVKQLLRQSSADLGKAGTDPQFGYGLINLHQALETMDRERRYWGMPGRFFNEERD